MVHSADHSANFNSLFTIAQGAEDDGGAKAQSQMLGRLCCCCCSMCKASGGEGGGSGGGGCCGVGPSLSPAARIAPSLLLTFVSLVSDRGYDMSQV